MSTTTKPFDAALDFLPATKKAPAGGGYVAGFIAFAEALSEGLAAAKDYQRLTAKGVAPRQAIQQVADEHFTAH